MRYGGHQCQGASLRIEAGFQCFTIDGQRAVKAIASALEAGWEPHSRGKSVTYSVDANGA